MKRDDLAATGPVRRKRRAHGFPVGLSYGKTGMREYIDPAWVRVLQGRRDVFESLWGDTGDWVEQPNQARGGWSGVARRSLADPNGRRVPVFVKRQVNHVYRDWRHPLRGRPTFEREIRNILALMAIDIPVLKPVYFGMRRNRGGQEAILVTEELVGYTSLETLQDAWATNQVGRREEKRAVTAALAPIIRRLNDARFQHGCLYPKHVFVRFDRPGRTAEVRLIDLEKARHRRHPDAARRRDLGSLNRHSRGSATRIDCASWSRTRKRAAGIPGCAACGGNWRSGSNANNGVGELDDGRPSAAA